MIISLGQMLPCGSSELPFLKKRICSCTGEGLPHSAVTNGGIAWQKIHIAILFTFHLVNEISIVSVALSLGLRHLGNEGILTSDFEMKNMNFIDQSNAISRRPLAALPFLLHCCKNRCSDFPPPHTLCAKAIICHALSRQNSKKAKFCQSIDMFS